MNNKDEEKKKPKKRIFGNLPSIFIQNMLEEATPEERDMLQREQINQICRYNNTHKIHEQDNDG